MAYQLIDCFSTNIKFWKLLGLWPSDLNNQYYRYYSVACVLVIVIIYNVLYTINLVFLPKQLDIFVGELIFFFMEVATISKVLTVFFLREKIQIILNMLEANIFKPEDIASVKIINNAKAFIIRYWKIFTSVSLISNLTHISSPMFMHLFLGVDLVLPVCSYSFLSDEIIGTFIYPLYFYQCLGMHLHVLYIVNIDCFFLGLMVLAIAQLKILDAKLRNVTFAHLDIESDHVKLSKKEGALVNELNKCLIHYEEISKFCSMVQDVFSGTLFVQFGMGSCIICICLFVFTMPAPVEYFVFLGTYMMVMTAQILVPCWFGTQIIYRSTDLGTAIYNCDWTPRTRQFKSNLRLFVERTKKPLSITGGKMFSLSLETFTSIMKSAYSFFTVLRHMQSRD